MLGFLRTDILCVYVGLIIFSDFARCELEVRIADGTLKGQVLRSRDGRSYYSYTGIPYAKPPIGELRFKAPQTADPWTGTLDATREPNKCVQSMDANGREDCLYLNVYVPAVDRKSLPVMFWIHGGAFLMGGGGPDEFGPEYFMDKDVVLVSINYRLGVLGFLSTEDDALPGNYGLKDQVAALRWVRENVARFNGDPDRVTIFGGSSGSASVGFHLLSPLSKGLFHRAVLQSGAPTCTWAVSPPGLARQRAHAVATIAGCNYDGSDDVLECLRKLPADLTVEIQNKLFAWQHYPLIQFGPVVENCDSNGEAAYLCRHPIYDFKQESFVPTIVGLNSAEGRMPVATLYNCTSLMYPEFRTDFNRLLSLILQYGHYTRPDDVDKIGEWVSDKYFPSGGLDENLYPNVVDIVSDGFFVHCIVDMVRRLESPVYAYLYDHRSEFSSLGSCGKHLGASHGDELISLFKRDSRAKNASNATDLEVSKLMVDVWCKFAVSDVPTVDGTDGGAAWPEFFSNAESPFLHIDSSGPKIVSNPFAEKYDFWSRLLNRFLRPSNIASQKFPYKKNEL